MVSVEGLGWTGMASGLVLKLGTRVTTMPAKAPNGHLWARYDRSTRWAMMPEGEGSWQTVLQVIGASAKIVRIFFFNSHTLKKWA